MAGWVRDPRSGTLLYQDDTGLVHVRDEVAGTTRKVAPAEASKLINDPTTGISAASHEDLQRDVNQQKWDRATAAEKADFYAREGIKGVVDAATAPGRAAFAAGATLGNKLAGAVLGDKAKGPDASEMTLPTEALSGENLVRKLDEVVGGEAAARQEAERARAFSEVAPGGKMVANTAGFLAGGKLLGVGLGLAGKALGLGEAAGAGSALGRIATGAGEGASMGLAGASDEAWVKDQQLTAESALANMGMGAILGGGISGAVEGAGLARRALAEKVFGAPRITGASAEAIEGMAKDVTGAEPPRGFAGKFKEAMDWIRDKVETGQSVATGVPKESLEKYGGLRWTDEAIAGRESYANREAINAAAAEDLTKSLQTMHEESAPILEETFRSNGLKLKNIRANLTGDSAVMADAVKSKADALEQSLAKLDELNTRGRPILGGRKATEDLRAAYEDTIDRVRASSDTAEAVQHLDEFKARMQRIKNNADTVVNNARSGLEVEQAKARAQLAADVSEDMRGYLEREDIWGKFGPEQRANNQAWTRALAADKYLKQQFFEKIGKDWATGRPTYVVNPAKVDAYINQLGTNRVKIVDDLLRDNVAARKNLAETIQRSFALEQHAGSVAKVSDSANKVGEILKAADSRVASNNIIDQMVHTAGGHGGGVGTLLGAMHGGLPGGVVGAAADTLLNPVRLMRQATALRQVTQRMGARIDGAVKALVTGSERVGKAARSAGKAAVPLAVSIKRYADAVEKLTELQANPVRLASAAANVTGDVTHPGVRDAVQLSTMRAVSFLQSKMPAPMYDGSPLSPKQLSAVAPADKARFMRYYDAVNDPGMVFDELAKGNAPPEHIEALKVVYPSLYQRAQMAVFEAVHNVEKPIPYQQRLNLSELFDQPGLIEPTLDYGFMQRLAASTQQASQQQQQKQATVAAAGRGSNAAASALKSPLDNLRI